MFINLGGGARNLMNQRSLEIPKTLALDQSYDEGMINTPSVFDRVMTSSNDGSINHGFCTDHDEVEALIVQSFGLYAAALFVAISMMIFAFGKASRQSTIVNQCGWKIIMPLRITLLRIVFFAFLTSHGYVFGLDEEGDNHHVVHSSIRGMNADIVKPNGISGSKITKLVKVRKPS